MAMLPCLRRNFGCEKTRGGSNNQISAIKFRTNYGHREGGGWFRKGKRSQGAILPVPSLLKDPYCLPRLFPSHPLPAAYSSALGRLFFWFPRSPLLPSPRALLAQSPRALRLVGRRLQRTSAPGPPHASRTPSWRPPRPAGHGGGTSAGSRAWRAGDAAYAGRAGARAADAGAVHTVPKSGLLGPIYWLVDSARGRVCLATPRIRPCSSTAQALVRQSFVSPKLFFESVEQNTSS